MGKHVFGPFFTYPCTFMALGGPKYGHCGGQNRVIEAGLSHDQDSVLCAISHLITWPNMTKGPFLTSPRTLMALERPKLWPLWGSKQGHYGGLVTG